MTHHHRRLSLAAVVLALSMSTACGDTNKKEPAESAAPPPVEPPTAEPPAPAKPPARPAGYPEDFPLLADGVRDPDYPPSPDPNDAAAFLYVFSSRDPLEVGAEITKAAEPRGWKCTSLSDPGRWLCIKGVKQVAVSAKAHPRGGAALFVSEMPDASAP